MSASNCSRTTSRRPAPSRSGRPPRRRCSTTTRASRRRCSPTDLLRILEDHRDLVGEQPLDELLTVKKTTKTYKALRHHRDLAPAFADAITIKKSTRFGHKAQWRRR